MANQNSKIKSIDSFRERLDDATDAGYYVDGARTFYYIEVRSDIRAEITIGNESHIISGLDVMKTYTADTLDELNACRKLARHEMVMNDYLFFDVFYVQTSEFYGDTSTQVMHLEREHNEDIDLDPYGCDDTEIEEPCYFEREY